MAKQQTKKDFPVISICREDLSDVTDDYNSLTDEEMREIASKMADAYLNNGYWQDLREIYGQLHLDINK
jgi:hypothetical protein